MSPVLAALVVLVPAYLLGAMPWGLWIPRLRGVDIRRRGSGNPGATNVYRELGPAPGLGVLALDIGKGAAAVLWARVAPGAEGVPGGVEAAALAAGLVSILGHVYTIFAGFRGGRGVATTIGAFLALTPAAMLLGLVAWLVGTLWSRRVSVGSLALAVVYPIGILGTEHGPMRGALFVAGLVIAVLIVLRHRDNVRRLLAGTEPPFSLRKRGEQAAAEPEPREDG